MTQADMGDQLKNLPDEEIDRQYALQYWREEKPESIFIEMIDRVLTALPTGQLRIQLRSELIGNLNAERALLSAHRRLALALGIDVGQFTIEDMDAVAPITEGNSSDQRVQQAYRDREHGVPYLKNLLQTKGAIRALMEDVKESIEQHNAVFRTVRPRDWEVRADRLSGARIVARALGYQAGQWEIKPSAGAASMQSKK